MSTSPPRKSRWARFGRIAVPVLLIGAAGAFFATPPAWRSVNDVTTGATKAYPDLQPRMYDMEVDQTLIFAAAAASRLPGWRVLRTDRETGKMTAHAAGLPFVSYEVSARVQTNGNGASRVVIRSRSLSPLGPGDWGVNARHIRALQAAMDDKLPPLREPQGVAPSKR